MKNSIWDFTTDEKKLISTFIAKGKAEQDRNEEFAIISFDDFYKLFTDNEVAVMKKYLAIDPKSLNYKLPFLGLEDNLPDIVPIPNQQYTEKGQQYTATQYLPKETYLAYDQMNKAMQKELGKDIKIRHGYRSPARQVFIFFDLLQRKCSFDFNTAVRRVCFPQYSEHVCTKRQAIDFMTDGGVCDGFEKTDKYQWLQNNAKRFGFFESYPKDNPLGMMYEPWHWHHE